MRYLLFPLVLILIILLAMAGSAKAEKRVALVIGNGAYQNAIKLPNPKNDAEDVAAALKRSGFETILGLDMTQAQMQQIAIRFSRAAREADVALFYYSGHAMQFAGVNYLMPIDANLKDEADLRLMARVDEIVADLQQAKNLRILVLDSCRDNPLAEQLKRSIGLTRAASLQRGLARLDSPQGMIVPFATQAGRTAADGSGRNSPFTSAFLKHIEAQEEIGTVFRRINIDVYRDTNNAQLPELSLSLTGEFYLHGRPSVAAPDQAPKPTSPAAQAWGLIQNTTSEEVLEAFLKEYPEGLYAALARAMLKEIKEKKVAVGVFPPSQQTSPDGKYKPGDNFKDCDLCPEMVVVPAGSFTMGSPANEKDRETNEGPQRTVTIAKPFAVGKFEVTFAQWDACVVDSGCNGYRPNDQGWGRGKRPVIYMSWNDAKAYVTWLSNKTGKTYRLLTEAEWEYAARAGTTTPFSTGQTITTDQANFDGKSTYGGSAKGVDRQKTVEVGSFQANAFGLHDMHGNVWEWVEDCWTATYVGAPSDGLAWTAGDCSLRVVRGGSWRLSPWVLRSAYRFGVKPGIRYDVDGFRVARTLN